MDSPDTSQQATGSQHSLVEEDDDGQEPLATAPTSTKAPKIAVIGKLSTYLVAEVGEDSVCLGGFYQNEICTIKLHMVYHAYESHFRITAIIPRIVPNNEENQDLTHRVMFQLPAAAFRRDMSKVTLNAVKSIESLPLAMRNDPKVADAISKDLLQCITFSFESIIAVGLHHPIEPTNDQVRCALKTLQRIPRQTNKAPALCPYEPSHIDDFNDMRDHLKEYSQPLYHYYSSRTNRAMTIWNSTISPEYLPGHLVPTEITFRDLDYWAITHTYGITYEAQTVLAMVETLSQTAVEMTAIEGVGYV